MSINTGARSVTSNLLARSVPECQSIGRSIKTSSTIIVVLLVLALIVMVICILYSYMKKLGETTSSDYQLRDKEKKRVIGGLSITSSVLIFIAAFVAVYQMSPISKAVRQCIPI